MSKTDEDNGWHIVVLLVSGVWAFMAYLWIDHSHIEAMARIAAGCK